ncbi:MAG: TonB-dependent receptor [Prevotella sp.]|nr:TonB-dependent receptor [Prevotella sp.]
MNRILTLALLAFNSVCSLANGGSITIPADTSRVVDLDEVIVVAQPKEQVRLRQQPLSSNAFGEGEMRQLNIHDLSQLSQHVPSFAMPAYGSRLTSSMYVRGIGSRINNPAVVVYYDNIPLMSKASFNNHFYMLDRVDILRGPQGTLYGLNAEGGLVRVYSKNPMSYQGTDINLGIGTGFYRNVELAHFHRPSDKLAFSLAGFYSGQNGFFGNQNFSEKNDKSNEAGGKGRLIWTPTEHLKIDWTTDYQYVNQNGFGYGEALLSGSELLTPADPATTIMNGYTRNMLNTGLALSAGVGGDLQTAPYIFTSTTSYQFLKDQMLMDQDYMIPDYLSLEQRQKTHALTQEFVLRSQNGSRWQHASGVFGSYQWLRTDAPVHFGDAITGPISDAITNAMTGAMEQSMYPRILQQMLGQGMPQAAAEAAAKQAVQQSIAGVSMTAEMGVPGDFHNQQMNYALFHESNILLADRLKLTLGLRLNHDIMNFKYHALAYMNMTGGTAQRQATYHLTSLLDDERSKSYTQLLPKFGLTFTLNDNYGNVYALVSKGARSGGYNIQMFTDILQADLNAHQQDAMRGDYDVQHTPLDYDNIEDRISYKPEESWNFEVGTHLNLFGGAVHADLALYYMDIRNQQVSKMSQVFNYGRIIDNAGKSHSFGAEATLRGKAVNNHLDWAVNYAYTLAKFGEYDDFEQASRGVYTPVSYKDNYVPFIPQHTFSAMADYHLGKLTIGANVAGQGKTWWNEANTFYQKAYITLGAHADYELGPVVVSLWGRNLTNTKYNTFAVESSAAGSQKFFAQKANPLQLGCDLRLHF